MKTSAWLLTASLVLTAGAALAQPPVPTSGRLNPDVPTLTVSGSAEVRATPDEATVRLGVTRQSATAEAAQEGVNEVAQGIRSAVTRLGVGAADIQTEQLNLFPIYAPVRPGTDDIPRIVAYRASNVVSVRTSKLSQAGPIVDAGLKAGANQLEGIQFSLREDLPARSRALAQAVSEAREKAQAMAAALGVRLVRVLAVEEGGAIMRPPIAYEGAMARMAATPVSPGQVGVNATVTLRYQIQER
jgi:uncharacterized protein YggE